MSGGGQGYGGQDYSGGNYQPMGYGWGGGGYGGGYGSPYGYGGYGSPMMNQQYGQQWAAFQPQSSTQQPPAPDASQNPAGFDPSISQPGMKPGQAGTMQPQNATPPQGILPPMQTDLYPPGKMPPGQLGALGLRGQQNPYLGKPMLNNFPGQ